MVIFILFMLSIVPAIYMGRSWIFWEPTKHPRWRSVRATAEQPKGLLGQLTERQRKLAFDYRGPIASWDENGDSSQQQ